MIRSNFNNIMLNFKTTFSLKPFVRFKSTLPISWERPEQLPPYHPSKSGDLKKRDDIDLSRYPPLYGESKELETLKPFVRFKSTLPISWERPEQLPPYHPSKSGDLKKRDDIDLSRYPPLYGESKELETADENVKRIFSLRFHKQRAANQIMKHDLADKVRRHKLDYTSREVKIALLTGIIRNVTHYMERLKREKQAPGPLRTNLKEMIECRRKHLRLLRQTDYRLFEWILDQLDLEFKPRPRLLETVERKKSMRRLADQYCEKLRDQRLADLKAEFEAKQIPFLEQKLEKLEWIKANEKEYNLGESVTDDDIENTRRKLEQLKMERTVNDAKIKEAVTN